MGDVRCGWLLGYGVLLTLSALILLPMGWMPDGCAQARPHGCFTVPPQWFPTDHWHWENFYARGSDRAQAISGMYMFNTLLIVAGNIAGTLISCSLVALRLRPAALPRQRASVQRAGDHHADPVAGAA